jgi:prepilin-type N-terminal cleavage/methylation domain-containing protein/prepilin-type processing-associated H-X9-DG protein
MARAEKTQRGFTLVEILIVIGVILVLAGLAFPIYTQVKARAKQTTCASNLKQLWAACMLYAQDNDGYLPIYRNCLRDPREPAYTPAFAIFGISDPHGLYSSLQPFVKTNSIWFCPTDQYAGQDVMRWDAYHRYSSYDFLFHRGTELRDSGRVTLDGRKADPDRLELIMDSNSDWYFHWPGNKEHGCEHFGGGRNIIYLDGHAGFLPVRDR